MVIGNLENNTARSSSWRYYFGGAIIIDILYLEAGAASHVPEHMVVDTNSQVPKNFWLVASYVPIK
jgi:hypothetical protein